MMGNKRVKALSQRFIAKLADKSPETEALSDPYTMDDTYDTIAAPPPDFEFEFEDEDTILPPPPLTPTLPSPRMEEYRSPTVEVGVEMPIGEVMSAVPEQVFSEFLTHNAPEGEHQLITLSIGDQTVGAYSVTNIPGQKIPQIRKMTNVMPLAYSLDDFMTWLETNQPLTWWKTKQVMKKYQ
jgi:hypothetical protein